MEPFSCVAHCSTTRCVLQSRASASLHQLLLHGLDCGFWCRSSLPPQPLFSWYKSSIAWTVKQHQNAGIAPKEMENRIVHAWTTHTNTTFLHSLFDPRSKLCPAFPICSLAQRMILLLKHKHNGPFCLLPGHPLRNLLGAFSVLFYKRMVELKHRTEKGKSKPSHTHTHTHANMVGSPR